MTPSLYGIEPDTEVKLYSNTGTWHIFPSGKRRCLCQASMKKSDFSKNTPTVKRTASETLEKQDEGLIGELAKYGLNKLEKASEESGD